MAKENKTIYAILGLLNHKAMTGYDIKKRIDLTLRYFWDAGFGQIYPGLKTLERNGWVECTGMAGEAGPDRNVYSITEQGREELKRWLSLPVEKEQVKYEILLKLFFGNMVPVEDNIRIIEEFKRRNSGVLNLFELFEADLLKVMSASGDHRYFYLTVLFGEKVTKAYLEWADEAIRILGESTRESGEEKDHGDRG